MSANDIDIHHLSAAYSLDALDERERAAFEAHYPACEVCRADVVAFRDAAAQLATESAITPPPALKARVLAEIQHVRQLSPLVPDGVADLAERRRRRRRSSVLGGLGLAAALVLVVVGGLVVGGGGSGGGDPVALDLSAVLDAPDGRMVALEGQAGAVMIAWSAERGELMVMADDLPPAPPGKAYELWLIHDEGSLAMGMLDPAPNGVMHHAMSLPARPIGWGLTLEPASGSPVPTSDILYHAAV